MPRKTITLQFDIDTERPGTSLRHLFKQFIESGTRDVMEVKVENLKCYINAEPELDRSPNLDEISAKTCPECGDQIDRQTFDNFGRCFRCEYKG